jgi:hypothetical protein
MGIETRTIDAAVAARCTALAPAATAAVDSTGRLTPLGVACGEKPAAPGMSAGAKTALGIGAAIVAGAIAHRGEGVDRPAAGDDQTSRQTPTTRPPR